MAKNEKSQFLVLYENCNNSLKMIYRAKIWPNNVKQYYVKAFCKFLIFLLFLKILSFSSKKYQKLSKFDGIGHFFKNNKKIKN